MSETYALQMPSNYALMDNDEMEYLDGGGISVKAAQVGIYLVMAGLGIAGSLAVRKAVLSRQGKYFGARAAESILRKVGAATVAGIFVKAIADFLINVFDPVGAITNYLDRADGRPDGYIGGKGWGWQWG